MKRSREETAEGWIERRKKDVIKRKRKDARLLYRRVQELKDCSDPQAELVARELLAVAASAFWNAEDTELEKATHRDLDRYGRWVRENIGCKLTFEKGQYYQRCPVAIAHKKVGLSIEYTTNMKMCSICGEDLAECIHDKRELYEVPGGVGPSGYCPVCVSSDCVEHGPDETHRVPPVGIIANVSSLSGIALVAKPADPDARFTSIPVDIKDLYQNLGRNFFRGMPVNCDRCLTSCGGIEASPLFQSHGQSTIEP